MNTSDPKLDLLSQIVQMLGFEVTGEYKNLVFVSENPFVLRMADDPSGIDLYFNEDIEEERAESLMAMMAAAGEQFGLYISYKGAFSISQNEDQSRSVELFDLTRE